MSGLRRDVFKMRGIAFDNSSQADDGIINGGVLGRGEDFFDGGSDFKGTGDLEEGNILIGALGEFQGMESAIEQLLCNGMIETAKNDGNFQFLSGQVSIKDFRHKIFYFL